MKLTAKATNQAEATGKQYFLWDDAVKGFALRVTPAGAKSYVIQYSRPDGRGKRRLTIASADRVNVSQAREKARRLLAQVDLGIDPAEEKRDALEQAAADPTVKELSERYLKEHASRKKPASRTRDQYLLDRFVLPALGRRRVSDVSRRDLIKIHEGMADTPTQANRVIALCSKMFNLAERWELRPDNSNPCRHVERYKEKPRKLYLSGKELSKLGAAIEAAETAEKAEDRISADAARLFRLVLLTGARVGEILSLRWDEVDFEQGALNLSDSKTGAKSVPLSAAAIKVLEDAPRIVGNPYVIPGRRNRKGEPTHMSNPAKPWNVVRKAAGLEDVRIHDLRHSFASVGAGLGMGLPVIGALLGHSQAQTTQRYAHLAQDPLKAAADLIAADIQTALDHREEEPQEAEVLEFKKR